MVRLRAGLRKRGIAPGSATRQRTMAQEKDRVAARVEQLERPGDVRLEVGDRSRARAKLDLGQLAGKLDCADRRAAALEPVCLPGEHARIGDACLRTHALQARAGVAGKGLEEMRQQAVAGADLDKRQL